MAVAAAPAAPIIVTVEPFPLNVMLLPPFKNRLALFVAWNVDVPALFPPKVKAKNCVDWDVIALCDPTIVCEPAAPVDSDSVTPFKLVKASLPIVPEVAASE